MPNARVLRCPNCGGAVREGERHCGFCRAPVATVRCARCYHMNAPEAAHCSGCGYTLGLEPAGESDYFKCARCPDVDLEVFCGGSGRLRDCRNCGGQFVEHQLLRELIERREVYGAVAPRKARKSNPLLDPVRYIRCPECRAVMSRKNFGDASGVIVDVCTAHGIWFDVGELPLVLEFVESGGLAAARRREMERLERQRVDSLAAQIHATAASTPRISRMDAEESIADAIMGLLHFVKTLISDHIH